MKILVLSDTHASSCSEMPLYFEGLKSSLDLIIHAGDFTGDDYLYGLERLALTIAVRGNMDGDFRTGNLPERIDESIEGWAVGIIHGRGNPGSVPDYVRSQFPRSDLVVFGHSHIPFLEESAQIVYLNPGSLNLPRHGGTGTFALIDLSYEELQCKILTIAGSNILEIARFSRRRLVRSNPS